MPTNTLIWGRDPAHQNAGDGAAWVQSMGVYAQRIELRTVGDVTTIYKAWADYGSDEADAVWRIQRIILDEALGLDVSDMQAGTGDFEHIWADRIALTYT